VTGADVAVALPEPLDSPEPPEEPLLEEHEPERHDPNSFERTTLPLASYPVSFRARSAPRTAK
jgi:hypothetical protein